jgi:hypothetical protein
MAAGRPKLVSDEDLLRIWLETGRNIKKTLDQTGYPHKSTLYYRLKQLGYNRRDRWSDEDLLKLYEELRSPSRVAKRTGYTYRWIARRLRKLGVEPLPIGTPVRKISS